MMTLAEAVVYLLQQLATGDEGLDWQECGDIVNEAWSMLSEASQTERDALTLAAKARLKALLREPDEHGYTPRDLITKEEREVLEELADGTVWQQYNNPDHA